MMTLWGEADYVNKLAEGVYSVGTPGHGGILVDPAEAETALSEAARNIGEYAYGMLAFEEDCAWAAVGYEHPEWLYGIFTGSQADIKKQAEETLRRWYPEYFEGGN